MPSCKLSIIVVCHKTYALTIECIRSILSFAPSSQYEIICVDNASSDGIGKEISKNFPGVQFIETQYNYGFSRANNLGIAKSRGEYILLLNSDTKIIDPLFDEIVEYMGSHPDAGAVGPRHLWEDGRFQASYGKFPTFLTELLRKFIQHRISSEKEVDWLSASCLLLRRKALQDAGLLDEAFFMYFEDIDLCTRIRNKGWHIRYFPKASIIHYHGKSVEENVFTSRLEYRRSQLYFTKKYYGKIGEISMRTFLFLRFLITGCWGVLESCFCKIFRKDTQNVYMQVLLSGKVISMAFLSKTAEPIEPILNA